MRGEKKEDGFGRVISRILSRFSTVRIICLRSRYPKPVPLSRKLERAAPGVSYLALHPMGFSVPRRLRSARCALTAPFHHHRQFAPAAVYFLWHFPSEVCPPPACIVVGFKPKRYAASRPSVFGLSSPGLRRKRFSALPKPCARYRPHFEKSRTKRYGNAPCQKNSAPIYGADSKLHGQFSYAVATISGSGVSRKPCKWRTRVG
jgi:hypothetical protein